MRVGVGEHGAAPHAIHSIHPSSPSPPPSPRIPSPALQQLTSRLRSAPVSMGMSDATVKSTIVATTMSVCSLNCCTNDSCVASSPPTAAITPSCAKRPLMSSGPTPEKAITCVVEGSVWWVWRSGVRNASVVLPRFLLPQQPQRCRPTTAGPGQPHASMQQRFTQRRQPATHSQQHERTSPKLRVVAAGAAGAEVLATSGSCCWAVARMATRRGSAARRGREALAAAAAVRGFSETAIFAGVGSGGEGACVGCRRAASSEREWMWSCVLLIEGDENAGAKKSLNTPGGRRNPVAGVARGLAARRCIVWRRRVRRLRGPSERAWLPAAVLHRCGSM